MMKPFSQFLEEKKKKKKEEKTSPVEPVHVRKAKSKLKRHRATHGKSPKGSAGIKRAELEGEMGSLESDKIKRVYKS